MVAGSSPTPGDPTPLVAGPAASEARGQSRGAAPISKEEAKIRKELKKVEEKQKKDDEAARLRSAGQDELRKELLEKLEIGR